MRTVNEQLFACPPPEAFELARRVDRWPELLPHYRWVRFRDGGPEDGGVVEMAARREFGRLPWPVWWVSRMWIESASGEVRYRHIDGITRGMDVLWRVEPYAGGSRVEIIHEWEEGPRFAGPLGPAVGRGLIGPLFIHAIAGRTLAGLARQASQEVAI